MPATDPTSPLGAAGGVDVEGVVKSHSLDAGPSPDAPMARTRNAYEPGATAAATCVAEPSANRPRSVKPGALPASST